MAGIGFELNKLFEEKGLTAKIRAYGYAGMVVSGPMLLGILLLVIITYLSIQAGAARPERDLLIILFTYALLFSLIGSSVFSVIVVRYVADKLYRKQSWAVMPAFYGSVLLTLLLSGTAYGLFLLFSGIQLAYQVLSLLLFLTLLVVWLEMNFLTAIREYKSVMLTFAAALVVLFGLGYVLTSYTALDTNAALLFSAWVAYGIMAVYYFWLLVRFFPQGKGSPFHFLKWIEKYPYLLFIGILIHLGVFGHIIIMWDSPWELHIQGWFHGAPTYDVSALIAVLSILITSINFVVSTETRFYPYYKKYFSLLNGTGNVLEVETTERKMIQVLEEELGYLTVKQIISTFLFVSIGTILLPRTALGFTSEMLGIYRMLCIGYALYAIGNSMLMILLYFEDNKGAFRAALLFALSTNLFTFLVKEWDSAFYGLGFILGSALFYAYTAGRLRNYMSQLKYHVLADRPIYAFGKKGPLSRVVERLERR